MFSVTLFSSPRAQIRGVTSPFVPLSLSLTIWFLLHFDSDSDSKFQNYIDSIGHPCKLTLFFKQIYTSVTFLVFSGRIKLVFPSFILVSVSTLGSLETETRQKWVSVSISTLTTKKKDSVLVWTLMLDTPFSNIQRGTKHAYLTV